MKTTIKNRKGQNIVVLVELIKKAKGLAFVMHGLGGFKEEKHIKTFAQAFKDKDYSVVRFDTTNAFGESDGNYKDATTTNYYEDLVDVINWAKTQIWFMKPFCLVGHSLGGLCVTLYAENHPAEVKALAPISTAISRKLLEQRFSKKELKDWKKNGWKNIKSAIRTGMIKRLKWDFMDDLSKHESLEKVHRLKMPVLMIVGQKDVWERPKFQKMLFDKIPRKKEMHIIKGAPHTFVNKRHLNQIKKIFLEWINKI
ncbi:hypothetical protein AYK26_04950 [Euryarchaeota archaeon SM23-78]|nr:MAG: hypothetical protein AYK26_04950 [Euryarchaeota archaeon SM23-78]MBW3000917.1 lysophospholipase [Candidatus Woesearchaeota archaeon]